MKSIILALAALVVFNAPAEAFDLQSSAFRLEHPKLYRLTHLGIAHKVATVASAPLFVVGFGGAMITGFVVYGVGHGIKQFCDHDFVSW